MDGVKYVELEESLLQREEEHMRDEAVTIQSFRIGMTFILFREKRYKDKKFRLA